MTPFWLTFTDGTHGCSEADSLSAAIIKAEDTTGKVVQAGRHIPYPAAPRIGAHSDTPSFCHSPHVCLGKAACPMEMACND